MNLKHIGIQGGGNQTANLPVHTKVARLMGKNGKLTLVSDLRFPIKSFYFFKLGKDLRLIIR